MTYNSLDKRKTMPQTILLLEDDKLLAETLYEMLEESGYKVDLATTGNEAVDLTYENRYDLYIFDINVPDMDGFELLKSLRNARDQTATIYMSALVDIQSIAKGFELGAEDYIKKPFFPEELLIRVRSKLPTHSGVFSSGDFSYDPGNNEYKRSGQRLSMGSTQEALFKTLYENLGKVVDREILLECLESPSSTALRVAINKLKQTTGLPIENLRGVGYVLEKR